MEDEGGGVKGLRATVRARYLCDGGVHLLKDGVGLHSPADLCLDVETSGAGAGDISVPVMAERKTVSQSSLRLG